MLIKLVSWNVNGLRAVLKKPDWDWFANNQCQIVGLQETKANPAQLPEEAVNPPGWNSYWDSSVVKKGYSGVAVFSRLAPIRVMAELPVDEYRGEGRFLHLEFEHFHYFNGYFPNGGADVLDENGKPTGDFKRLKYKLGFLEAFAAYSEECRKSKPVVICGDLNIAHQPIDLTRPKENEKCTGFLPVERAWMNSFLDRGYIDTFRYIHGPQPDNYTWWSYKMKARARNVGWRIDYFFVSEELAPHIRDAWIEKDVHGSDHCPVGLALEF